MDSDQVKAEKAESGSMHQSISMPDLTDPPKDEQADVPADTLPEPVPGPAKDSSINSWPVVPHALARYAKQAFFISPLPLKVTPKASKTTLDKKKTPSNEVVVFQTTGITKQATASTTKSDATEAELEHDLRVEEKRRRQEFPRRLLTAAIGGIFVIVPMHTSQVVMSLGRTMAKCLITSTVAILLFGFMLAWSSTSDEAGIFIATAGYAAFLAVFVAVGND
ncbi:hypothetical protein PG993_006393 [Apiospora rasikravindrae]|uniref:DUF6594 domain-containing protein n=1 Tax=Apiospora rasikravindrae TaxID=990691 RepID=A0ABR1T7D8_9PEZI